MVCLLRELYGAGVERLRIEQQTFETPSKKKIDINTIASNYHIEVNNAVQRLARMSLHNLSLQVNPSDAGIYDRIVIQGVIKTLASAQQLNAEGQREFKVRRLIKSFNDLIDVCDQIVVINEVDRLTKDAQHALRRTMEKYMATCRIFLVTNSTSKVNNKHLL